MKVFLVALLATSSAVAQEVLPTEREPFVELANILPSAAKQQELRRRHLGSNSFARHLVPHLPIVWMEYRAAPEAVQTRLAELLRPAKLVHVHVGMLLDGRQVYTGRSKQHPEYIRTTRALLVLDPDTGKLAGAQLPTVTMQDDWFAVPPLQQVDTDQDGEMELVLKVHHHNGTIEDGDAQHYLRVVGDQLTTDLVIREAGWVVEPPNEGGYLRQAILHDGPLALRLVTWFEYANQANILVPLGECYLRRKGPRLPFEPLGTTAWVAGSGWRLQPLRCDFAKSK